MTQEPAPYDLDTDWAENWSPDHGLVAAVLARQRSIATITAKQDRCWLVAGLSQAGLAGADIADRLKCSMRLVRKLQAEDMTTVCRAYHHEAESFGEELRLTRYELAVRTRELADVLAEATRVREQRNRLIDMAMTGEPIKLCKNQHVLDRYTTYTHPKTGKVSCRTCRHDAVERYRAKLTSPGDDGLAPPAAHGAPGGLAGVPASVATAHAGGLGDPGPAT